MRISFAAIILLSGTSVSSISIGPRIGHISGIEMPDNVAGVSGGHIYGLEAHYSFSTLTSFEIAWLYGKSYPNETQVTIHYPIADQEGRHSIGMTGFRLWLSNVYLASDITYQYTKVNWYNDIQYEYHSWENECIGGSIALGWRIEQILDLQCRLFTPYEMLAVTVMGNINMDCLFKGSN